MPGTLNDSSAWWYPALALLASRGAAGVSDEEARSLWGGVPRPGAYDVAGVRVAIGRRQGCVVLEDGPAPLDGGAVRQCLSHSVPDAPLLVLPFCDSTNTVLLSLAAGTPLTMPCGLLPDGTEQFRPPLKTGALVAAETQMRGRGRWGRLWSSPPFVGLWFSLWYAASSALRPAMVPAAMAVGVIRALRRVGARDAQITWPNDIFLASGKVGGILVEEGRDGWALGLGLNVSGVPLRFAGLDGKRIPHPPVALESALATTPDRSELLAALVGEIVDTLRDGAAEDVGARWKACQRLTGRKVGLRLRERLVVGRVCNVDPERGILLSGSATWFMPDNVVKLEELDG